MVLMCDPCHCICKHLIFVGWTFEGNILAKRLKQLLPHTVITSYWQILVLINGISVPQSDCPCVCVGWRFTGGIFLSKQRQDPRDYGLGLFNGECKTRPWGYEVPTNSGSASLHKFKSLRSPSPYDWIPILPEKSSPSIISVFPFPFSCWCFWVLFWPLRSDLDPLCDWLPAEGCWSLSEADNILFPSEVERGEKYLD